ncbi:MAG: hypothetical protein HKN00_00080 [Flavobacteriaceae bacterium]|nr:hypothetical protein [Flavobacteriaceae bacterium]
MRTTSTFFIIGLLLLSCQNKEVQLAESLLTEVTEVTDVSPIYIFYNEENGMAEFNRNNMIGTTNWLVNIDKRLNMEKILPHLIYLQNKRMKDGMHKNEMAKNYFSCSNPEIQNLTFIDFSDVIYHDESIAEFMKKKEPDSTSIRVYVNLDRDGTVVIGKRFALINADRETWINKLNESAVIDSLMNDVYLNFNAAMSFQDYIEIKSSLDSLNQNELKISTHEFIY